MEKNIAFGCPLINPELTIWNYKRFLKYSEKSLFSHGLGSSGVFTLWHCVKHVLTITPAGCTRVGTPGCLVPSMSASTTSFLAGFLWVLTAGHSGTVCGRREGRKKKERVTLLKVNFIVPSTKIWHLLWGKAIEFDIYKIFWARIIISTFFH